jgi:uncharacterized SAM-dependent methyltransferase
MIKLIIKKIKELKQKIYLQNKNTSLIHHNFDNYDNILNQHDFELEKNKHVLILNSFLNKFNFILRNELKSDNIKEYLIFDIGAGTLIHTNYFCNFAKKVYSIEPSLNALKIGKKIYGNLKNNIIINDFAEDALKKLPLGGKCFFHTGHVLSHLTNQSTKQILEIINNNSSIGSYLLFDEIWSNKVEVNNKLFYVRNKKFWKSNLSNFDINFYEFKNNISGISFYKGFFGKKVK